MGALHVPFERVEFCMRHHYHHPSFAKALFHACGSAGRALVSSCDSGCSPGKTLDSDQSGTENDFGTMEILKTFFCWFTFSSLLTFQKKTVCKTAPAGWNWHGP